MAAKLAFCKLRLITIIDVTDVSDVTFDAASFSIIELIE